MFFSIHSADTCPLSPPKCQKQGIWGEESCPSLKFDSPIVAFGGGWEGAGDKLQISLEAVFFDRRYVFDER